MENQLHWVKKCVFLPLKYFYFEVNIVHLIGKKYQESNYTSLFTPTMNVTHIRIPVLRIPYYYYYSQKCPSHSNGLLPLHKKVYRKKNHTQSGSRSRLFFHFSTMKAAGPRKLSQIYIQSLLFTKCRISPVLQ